MSSRAIWRLKDVKQSISDVRSLLAGKSLQELRNDRVMKAAFERFLEILSEASRHIPQAIKAQEPAIPWQRVADLGNRLRRAYHDTNPEIIWNIAQNDPAPLQAFAEKVMREGDSNSA
jgi:uncharacterized protein with HEPN domain